MAKKRREFAFQHVRTTGPMLPADVLSRVAIEDSKLPGLAGTDYGLAASERLGVSSVRPHRVAAAVIARTHASVTVNAFSSNWMPRGVGSTTSKTFSGSGPVAPL